MLAIPVERLEYIINKAPEFHAEVSVEPDAVSGPEAPDHDKREALLDTPANPAEQERPSGRCGASGTARVEPEEWPEALRQARETMDVNLTDDLVATRLLGDYLEEGASAVGALLGDVERG
jgi:hypothetical protein